MLNSGVSLADIAAVTDGNRNGNGSGFGNDYAIIILFLLFAAMGWGGNGGFGNGGGAGAQGALTRGDLCMDMNFNGLANDVGRIADNQNAIARQTDNAICSMGYNNAQLANGIQMQIGSEFRGLDNAICTLGFNNQAGFNALSTQLAQCCCDQKAEAAQTRYDMATGFCNLGNLIQNATRDLTDQMNAQYTRELENRLYKADLKASQEEQTAAIVNKINPCPEPAYIVPNPNCCYGNYGFNGWGGNCGCGCGNY